LKVNLITFELDIRIKNSVCQVPRTEPGGREITDVTLAVVEIT
jgi:hypothetical protein